VKFANFEKEFEKTQIPPLSLSLSSSLAQLLSQLATQQP
jgi:hypothetical protein